MIGDKHNKNHICFNKHFATIKKSAKNTPKDKELRKTFIKHRKSLNASNFEKQFTLNEFNQALIKEKHQDLIKIQYEIKIETESYPILF
jgi:hypothetical protein